MPPGKIFKEKLGSNQLQADCTLTLGQADLLSLVRNCNTTVVFIVFMIV